MCRKIEFRKNIDVIACRVTPFRVSVSVGITNQEYLPPDITYIKWLIWNVSYTLQISQLIEDVHKLQTSIGKLQETTANQIARLEEELSHRKQHILRLESRLETQKDYEEIKRQLWWVCTYCLSYVNLIDQLGYPRSSY